MCTYMYMHLENKFNLYIYICVCVYACKKTYCKGRGHTRKVS